MSIQRLFVDDACMDCIIAVLEQSGERTDAEIADALRRRRDDPMRQYARELLFVDSSWEAVVRSAAATCRDE